MIVVGVDPGLSGAICAMREHELLLLAEMPTIAIAKGKTKRRHLLVGELADLLRTVAAGGPARAFVERVHAMPKQGVASSFSFGVCAGAIAGVLATLAIPFEYVEPATWKSTVGLARGAEKNASVELAQRLFPAATIGRHDGKAEALLLCEYGRRRLAGERA